MFTFRTESAKALVRYVDNSDCSANMLLASVISDTEIPTKFIAQLQKVT